MTKHNDETRERIARARRGKRHSEETKAKIRQAQLRRWARWRSEREASK